MVVLQAVGIVVALAVIVLMALGPTLVELNDRFPARAEEPEPRKAPVRPTLTRQPAHHH